QLEPGSAAYNVPVALRLRGVLRVDVLGQALDEVVRRHEAIRTVFATRAGEPVQIIRSAGPVPMPLVDLRRLGPRTREAEALRLAAGEGARPFDLGRGPLLRATLLRLGKDDHVSLFTLHHVVSDGWSAGVLMREVSELYAALEEGRALRLPELAVQYADYAVWQRAWLSGDALEAQLAFWREQLRSAPPLLEIPTDRPRVPGQGGRAGRHSFTLSPEVSHGLRELARREGATLFMTMLAGWQALLGRYAGYEDVVVGTPIAGRTRTELEGLIGFFVNMLALRADLAGDPTWAGLLGRVRSAALGAYGHQELPFERLVEELGVERSLTHTPVFQVIFALNRPGALDEHLRLGGLELEPFAPGGGAARFDLDLAFADAEDALSGVLLFRESLFEPGTIRRTAGHLEVVLETLAAYPEQRLSEVSLLRGTERVQVLEAWNATGADYPRAAVHELVSAQAARTPDAVAVVFEGESLSYAELEQRSDHLARQLRRMRVGPETRVGICAERSVELVVALLSVLRAGGAYVPLDSSYPAERLAYMLEDSGVPVLLTQERLLERLPAHRAQVVCLDRDADLPASGSGQVPALQADPDSLAYVIYTSGSTGRPKGAM
ncbi:MAG TPA: condensation domain-containing protein, partial [Longimicrobiaceae bacterium]|nr:condensation domain-containing protein [Longimicrobiaceae bacterium]